MPDGVPNATRRAHVPAADDLPKLVDAVLAAKAIQPPQPELLRSYQCIPRWRFAVLLHTNSAR
eukprot:639434-Pleurochrysis_carterae.AAC.1